MAKFVSRDLSSQLEENFKEIVELANYTCQIITDWRVCYIMEFFTAIPSDPFKRLIGLLTFQDVFVLLHQGEIDRATRLVEKYAKWGKDYWWPDTPLNFIKSGRLLSSGK